MKGEGGRHEPGLDFEIRGTSSTNLVRLNSSDWVTDSMNISVWFFEKNNENLVENEDNYKGKIEKNLKT